MKIRKASASFGCLNGNTLELGDGLNIVHAPNESGKSTWCAFLRSMFYGVNTAERDKTGFLSDKTKYQPWNGGAMEGSMDILAGDKEITIQRTALGRAPMKNFTAVYKDTDIAVPGLTGENAGVSLLGVTSPVFERSAFIRQSGVKITQNSELEKRITGIVSSGDEEVSYSDADSRLRSWLRRRKYNNSGAIPAAQSRIKDIQDALGRLAGDNAECAKLRKETAQLTEIRKLLEQELKAFTVLEKIEEQENVISAKNNADDARREADRASAELASFGNVDDSYLNSIRGEFSALDSFEAAINSSASALEEAKRSLTEKELRVKSSVFAGKSPEEAEEALDKVGKTLASSNKKRSTANVISAVFAVLVIALCIAGFLIQSPVRYGLWAAAAVFAVITAILNFSSAKASKAFKAALDSYGMSGIDEFGRKVESYHDACAALNDAKLAYDCAKDAFDKNTTAYYDRISSLIAKAKAANPAVETLDDILPCLEEIEQAKRTCSQLESRAAIAAGLYESIEKTVDMTEVTPPAVTPRFTKSRTQAMLNDTVRRLENISAAYNMTLGRMRGIGDPMVLRGQQQSTEEELKSLTAEYDALNLAVSALKEADSEIQSRFAPVLAKTAGTVFHKLTGVKYDMLAFDRTFDAAAQAHGDTVSHNVLALSEGTSNQIYLALRIAVCLLTAPGEDPCPIILDDALVTFDDERMGYALDYLKELAKTRQVILFTCQSREGAYFAGDSEVTVTAL